MSTERIEDTAAFPTANGQFFGMSLRDYFAAKALPAIYADSVSLFEKSGYPENWRHGLAIDSYAMADAMLKAREQS